MYHDCFECGGKCCKFFGVPIKYISNIHTEGVPLKIYQSDLEMSPQKYFEIHEGIELNPTGDKFIVSKKIKTKVYNTRLSEYVIVYSKCTKLGEDGKCSIYKERSDMCKNFVARTAHMYLVLNGCIFDPGNLGEDFGIE